MAGNDKTPPIVPPSTENGKIIQIAEAREQREPIWTSQVIDTRNMQVVYRHAFYDSGPAARTAMTVIRWMVQNMSDGRPEQNARCRGCRSRFGPSDGSYSCGLPVAVYVVENSEGTCAYLEGVCQKCIPQIAMHNITDTTPAAPFDITTILKVLRLNALKIMAWTETLGRATDWDSLQAEAILDYIDGLLDFHSCVLGKPAEYSTTPPAEAKIAARSGDGCSLTWPTIEATLPPETIAAVDRRVQDLEERLTTTPPMSSTATPA